MRSFNSKILPEPEDMEFNPDSETLVQTICDITGNQNPMFFRILVAYYMTKMASTMRATVKTVGSKPLPINMYAFNLAPSGFGKNYSINIMEDQVLDQFMENFRELTIPVLEEDHLPVLAHQRAARKNTSPEDEEERVRKEYNETGPFIFQFAEGSSPALKQFRHHLLMLKGGAINFEMDEIASNLLGNGEALNVYLELYDKGKTGDKLIKNNAQQRRMEPPKGVTPSNMLAFGETTKLFDGDKTESEFYALLNTGYARRCFFGFARAANRRLDMTAEEMVDAMEKSNASDTLVKLSDRFGLLADPMNMYREISMPREVAVHWMEYRRINQLEAEDLTEYDELRRKELDHRHFKTAKLAGTYAFLDGASEISLDHLYQAIRLSEASGEAYDMLLTRDRPYVKVAKYLASVNKQVTHADMVEDLPFYKGTANQKTEMLNLAIAWGHTNNVIIKKSYVEGIELLAGETLQKTSLDNMILSYSQHVAYNYLNAMKNNGQVAFDKLHKLTQLDGYHWCNHHLLNGEDGNGHRSEDSVLPGFNMVVLDVDDGTSLATAKMLLSEYAALYYTTKRHGVDGKDRFRVVLPTNFVLKMDSDDYKEFMQNLYEWLPFEVDTATGQRSRKWLSHNGHHEYNDGVLLDVTPFIPKTRKNEERKKAIVDLQSLSNLERWFVNNTGSGNRNKQLIKYALLLVDSGLDVDQVRSRVLDLNQKIPDKLEEAEIHSTIMISATKAIVKRDSQKAA